MVIHHCYDNLRHGKETARAPVDPNATREAPPRPAPETRRPETAGQRSSGRTAPGWQRRERSSRQVDAALLDAGGIQDMSERLPNALLEVERRREDVARLEQRNVYLEGELKTQERHLTNALKDNVVLKQQLAKKKPAKRR